MSERAVEHPDAVPAPDLTDPPSRVTSVDPGTVNLDECDVVPAALGRLRDAARACCHVAARNGFYPADLAVEVLSDSTAALAVLADHVAPYAVDFWPAAGRSVDAARAGLTVARQHLDTARHHMALLPADDQQVPGTA